MEKSKITMSLLKFSKKDFDQFYQWLALNEESITWQKKYDQDFHNLWDTLFSHDITLTQLTSRFTYICKKVKAGPLNAWFKWLQSQLIIYCFVQKEMSLNAISEQIDLDIFKVAFSIRNFYVDKYPLLSDHLDEIFEPGHLTYISRKTDIHLLRESLPIDLEENEGPVPSTMSYLEVTLYPEWQQLLKKMTKNFLNNSSVDMKKVRREATLSTGIRFIRELLLLSSAAALIIFSLRWGNQIYGNMILEKIKILEPSFQWLNKDLLFQDTHSNKTQNQEIIQELSQIEQTISVDERKTPREEERFETESDIIISSLNDFLKPTSEEETQSNSKRFNFRSYRFGSNKVYRIIIQSVRPDISKKKLNLLVKKYNVTSADNTQPGVEVPGGLYYNLYAPREHIRGFIDGTLNSEEEATIYETKTRGKNPKGKNRIFIFIKSI